MSSDATEPALSVEGLLIGEKLRSWRTENGLTLAVLAEACALSIGYISQVERGLANPSLETLKRLTDAMGHRVGELFDDGPAGDGAADGGRYWITRRDARKKIQYPGSGIINELLSPDLRHMLEVIWVQAPVGATSGGHPHSHAGEECGFVVAGSMMFWVDGEEQVLEEGDSIYLDSTVPHRWKAVGSTELRALWLITPPTF